VVKKKIKPSVMLHCWQQTATNVSEALHSPQNVNDVTVDMA